MKREIKFRVWGRWGEWEENEDNRKFIMVDCDLLKDIEDEAYYMQFTGLHYEDGREVYEGDVVWATGHGNRVIEYSNKLGAFGFKSKTGFEFLPLNFDYLFKYRGNIYENPELLKP